MTRMHRAVMKRRTLNILFQAFPGSGFRMRSVTDRKFRDQHGKLNARMLYLPVRAKHVMNVKKRRIFMNSARVVS